MNELNKITIDGDLIFVLTIAIICDMISGVVNAILTKSYKSGNFRTGLLKKILDYVIVIISILVGYVLHIDYIESGTVTVLIFMEISSVIENCNQLIKVPSVLQEAVKANTEKEGVNEDVKG